MSNKWLRFLAFLGINLLAAYAPAVLWVPGLPGSASVGWKFLFSPVLLALLMAWATDPVVASCILIAFLGLVGMLSAVTYRWKKAWVVMPCIVVVYSLLQGLLGAQLVIGIDAIGHS